MTRALLVLCVLCGSTVLFAQRSEVGFGVGAFNYTGDLVRTFNFVNSRPGATAFYRANMSNVISFRAALTGGEVTGSDKRPIDPLASMRKASFNIFLLEASTIFEYHFLDWKDAKRPLRFTPYLMAGLAMFVVSGDKNKAAQYSNVQPAIPFGGGLKYIVSPKTYVSLEFGIRKTFFDYLDNVSGGDPSMKNYQYGNPNDNDNYYFIGLTFTRTFYEIPCPKNPY
jgi:Domain of unknown function (DUF6089)